MAVNYDTTEETRRQCEAGAANAMVAGAAVITALVAVAVEYPKETKKFFGFLITTALIIGASVVPISTDILSDISPLHNLPSKISLSDAMVYTPGLIRERICYGQFLFAERKAKSAGKSIARKEFEDTKNSLYVTLSANRPLVTKSGDFQENISQPLR